MLGANHNGHQILNRQSSPDNHPQSTSAAPLNLLPGRPRSLRLIRHRYTFQSARTVCTGR